ncbi:MAG: hypothetical protein ACK6BZ_09110 [Candidatus Kapaibacterium sp.]
MSQTEDKSIIQNLNTNLTFAQSSVYDLKEGEKNSFDFKIGTTLRLLYELPKTIKFTSHIRINIGAQQERSELFPEGYIKSTDNDFLGESAITFLLGWKVDPFISATLRTQPTESYRLTQTQRLRTMKLWDPVVSQQTIGLAQDIRFSQSFITLRGGINLQQIRADAHREQTDNPSTRFIKEGFKQTAGFDFLFDSQLYLDSTITFLSRSSVRRSMTISVHWNVMIEHELRSKVWKMFGIILQYSAIYNPLQTERVQQRFSMSIGIVQDW